jgi:hypothetical protein
VKITQEEITVVADVDAREVLVLSSGYRIELSEREGRHLVSELRRALDSLDRHKAPVALTAAHENKEPATGDANAALEGLVRVFESRTGTGDTRREGFRPL